MLIKKERLMIVKRSLLVEERHEKQPKWQPCWIGYVAVIWSVLYGALHLYWLLGGAGYPFKNERVLVAPMVTHLPERVSSIVFVIFCLMGIGIGLAMQKTVKSVWLKWLICTYAWGGAIALLLFVPDANLIAAMAYAFLLKFYFSWQMINQIICIIGALLWMMAVVVYQRKTRSACEYCGRKKDGETFFLVRWGRLLTVIAALAPVPYAITRFAWALNIPLGVDAQFLKKFSEINPMAHMTDWLFGSLCIGGGLLTIGLIQKWGEIFPSWFPFIGGRRVPIMLAVIPASIVAIAVAAAGVVFTFNILVVTLHLVPSDDLLSSQIWGTEGPMIFWLPWGITLGLAAIAYYYRRRGRCFRCGREDNM
ncbi:hypothetical protein ACFDTO_15295 [Microbacteriaceae bacterium 4G12]